MNRKKLAVYVAFIAGYEVILSGLYVWWPAGPPTTLDPRLPIKWVFASVLDKITAPLSTVLLASFSWHAIMVISLFRSSIATPIFAIGETILSAPGLLVYGAALLGFGGHGFTGSVMALGLLVYALCSVVPAIGAWRMVFRENLSAST